jgi:hypothetical protein
MRYLLSLAVVTATAGATTLAHHSISGVYDSSRQVTVDGTVSEFRFVNPHPFVVVEVRGADGAPEQWRLELDNRFELIAIGMTADTLTRGERVVAAGSRARDGSRGLYVRQLDRPEDGLRYEQVGSSPRIRVSR